MVLIGFGCLRRLWARHLAAIRQRPRHFEIGSANICSEKSDDARPALFGVNRKLAANRVRHLQRRFEFGMPQHDEPVRHQGLAPVAPLRAGRQ